MKKTILAACAALALTVACTPAASAEQVNLWYVQEETVVCNTHGQIETIRQYAQRGDTASFNSMLDLERCGYLTNTMVVVRVQDYRAPFVFVKIFNPANRQTFSAWIAEWQLTLIE